MTKSYKLLQGLSSLIFKGLFSLIVLLTSTLLYAQDPPQYGTPFNAVPDPPDASIYQVNMRSFSSTRNLQGVINRLDQIRDLGVNVIQLMPIQPVSTHSRAKNSPYAWKDWTTVGAEYGSLATLRALVDGAHARGMAVIMDWVANQTGWDHPWITQHPDWYVRNSSGEIQTLNGWNDVAALNHSVTAMRDAQIAAMRYWVFAANIDGFRFDYANGAPASFWTPVISNLKGITSRKLIVNAEGDASGLFAAGFDYTFSWNFYGNIKAIRGGSSATLIDNSNTFDYNGASGSKQAVRWLSNHDIYGSEGSPYNILGGKNGVLSAFVVTALMKSVPFIYNGMEVGNTVAMPFPFTSSVINWSQDVSITPLMTQILAFRRSSNAIRRGTLTSYTTANVCAFRKVSGSETVFVLANQRNSSQTFTLPSGIANTTMVDAFTNASVNLGTSITLSPYQYRVFKNAPTSSNSLTVSPGTLSFASAAGSQNVSINSNVTWTVTDNQTWITVSPTSGSNNATITVSATANTGTARSGTITVTGGGLTRTIAVSQSAAGATGTYYTIRNRWNNTYLYDAGANVGYGSTVANNNYKWQKVAVDATYFHLRNLGTGEYMHIENQTGSVQCTAATTSWWSAQWSQETVDATWSRFRNRWQIASIIHIENLTGFAQYAGAQDGWYSAQWQLAAVSARLGIEEAEIKSNNIASVDIYPNPSGGRHLNVSIPELADHETATVTIRNLNGGIELETKIHKSGKIEHQLRSGLYFVKVSGNGINVIKKIAIE